MPKTKKDLMLETTRMILEFANPAAARDFERKMPKSLRDAPTLRETISDKEYEQEVAKIRANLPGIAAYLAQYKISDEFLSDVAPSLLSHMNKKPVLKFPPGVSLIDDEIAARTTVELLGVSALSPSAVDCSGPVSRHMLYEHHPTHWLLIGAHHGYVEPSKNGHEILCMDRREVSEQEARNLFEFVASITSGRGPVQVGLLAIKQ